MKASFIFYLLGIADVSILFYNFGQTLKWLTCTKINRPYILERRVYLTGNEKPNTPLEILFIHRKRTDIQQCFPKYKTFLQFQTAKNVLYYGTEVVFF